MLRHLRPGTGALFARAALAAACALVVPAAASQAVSTFQVHVDLPAAVAPACGVSTGSQVTLSCSGTTVTQLVITPLPSQVGDGWTPWLYTGVGPLRTFGSARTPVTEVYSRNLSVGGLQYLEMTFSW
jgi:hypothetical protein